MSFGFGNPTSSAAGGFSFGANKTTSTGFTLSTPSAPASGNLFGTTTFGSTPSSQPGAGLFGQTTGLSFGTPVASVAPTTQATGLTFGATPTPGSTFGATATTPGTGLSFGATSVAPTFGAASTSGAAGLTFGATSTAGTTGLAFGSPATTSSTGISFGAPAGQTGGLSFGSPATGAQTGSLGFGTPPTGTNFAFGNTVTSTAASSGIKFNLPTTSTLLTGLPFGTTTTTAQTGLAFGTQITTQSGLTFGTPTTTTQAGLSFGTPTTSVAAGTTTAVVTPGFQGLGASSTATTKPLTFGTPSTGFSLGAPTAATTTTTSQVPTFGLSSGGGLFGQGLTKPLLGATTSGPTLGLGLGVGLSTTTTAATTTSSKGLGGVDATQSKPGLTGASPGRTDTNAVKENLIPNEIVQTIESFKSFVKAQKSHSSDIARGSAKPLHKVQEDTEALKQLLAGLTSGLQKNGMLSDKLKSDTAKCLHHAELAQRTHETPAGLQYDNLAPLEFFLELVSEFETDLRVLRQELENTEKHVLSLSQSSVLTPQELTLAMRQLHDSFVALAGRLHTVHNSVELQKEQYLNLRKYFLKDTTNVFEETEKKSAMSSTAVPIIVEKNAPGPTPFSGLGSQHGFGMLPSSSKETNSSFTSGNPLGIWGAGQPVQQQQQPLTHQLPQVPSLSTNTGTTGMFSSLGFSSNLGSTLSSPQATENQSFQLQKPPPGNKRSKR